MLIFHCNKTRLNFDWRYVPANRHYDIQIQITHRLVFNADGSRMMKYQNVALKFPASLGFHNRVNHHHAFP